MNNGQGRCGQKRKASLDETLKGHNVSSSSSNSYQHEISMKCTNENSCNEQDNSSCSQSLGSLDTVETSRVKSTCEEDNYVNFRSDRLADEASGLSAPVPCNTVEKEVANERRHSSAEKLPSSSKTTKKSRITPIFVAPLGSDAYI